MARLLYTIWALMLNSLRLSIFWSCFAINREDAYGNSHTSPPITTFLFATSVYVIIVNSTLFPPSFREPIPVFMCLYEFLATAFFLELSIACLWTPIYVHILNTLSTNLVKILYELELIAAAGIVIDMIKPCMMIITNGLATMILILTLYVTRAVDFKELTDNGVMNFLSHLRTKLWQRIRSELLEIKDDKQTECRCDIRRKRRNMDRVSNRY